MNQIALGDAVSGWLVLAGHSVAAPFKRASFSPVLSSQPSVADQLSLSLEGSPGQISASLAALDKVRQRSLAYSQAGYPSPQYLRFQPSSGGAFFYTPLSDLVFEFNSNAYASHLTGSLFLTLHFIRPNWFDSDPIELPLTNRNGTRITGGLAIKNHTDYHPGHDSSVLIDPSDIESSLPAPLRIELNNSHATGDVKDIFIGLYHHPSYDDDTPFFLQVSDFIGGSLLFSESAINDHFRRLAWSSSSWSALSSCTLAGADVALLAGRSYRPLLRLFSSHAYSDLYLKIKLQKGSLVLWEGDAVFCDPSYRYLFLPPLRIPPHHLLNELQPHHIDLVLYGQHETAGTYQLDIDQLYLLPLDTSASFLGFFLMEHDDVLIDDSFRGIHNVHYSVLGSETVAHLRQGGPMLISPVEYNRLFFALGSSLNAMPFARSASVRAYYRKRVRLL